MSEIFDTWWGIIRDGLTHINPVQGLIIGVLFGWTATNWGRVLIGALLAAVVYVAVDVLWPVLFHHQPFLFPAFDTPFWHFFIALYFAFLVVVAFVYIIKNVIESMRG